MSVPKWLFAEDHSGRRFFAIHTDTPKFISEFRENENGFYGGEVALWIDAPQMDVALVARLMRECADAVAAYDERLETDIEEADEKTD